jgi:hypothetical protein
LLPIHRARLSSWTKDELKRHLAAVVDVMTTEKESSVSPLDVALELLGGEQLLGIRREETP